jgi:glycosidase
MFNPWEDESKRILNKNLVDYHKKYVDMCLELGIDGIRADVARAKPVEFWDEIIPYARSKDPEFAFLAESYTYEDASPMLNMPKDRPEDLLRAGFDSYYGQYHIFNEWSKASEFNKYVEEQLEMSKHLPKGKSLIGSFATHDDKSPMSNGGVPYCNLTTGLQMTLPMLNPYYVTGFESGDKYIYSYKDKEAKDAPTGNNAYFLHNEKLDIFNMSRKPGGENPEIGKFMSNMSDVRNKYQDIITKGSYIPLTVRNDQNDKVIAYARHLNGKTLLVVANKDVNAFSSGMIKVPGLKPTQPLNGLSMEYTAKSELRAGNGEVEVSLARKFYVFEIDTPNIEMVAEKFCNKTFNRLFECF